MKKITVIRNNEIYDHYKLLVKEGKDFKDALAVLSKENDIGVAYVKNILKAHGVSMQDSKSNDKKSKRDERIIEMYMIAGKDQMEIAEEFGLTATRIGQIIRDGLGKYAKNNILEKSLEMLRKDIDGGMSHKDVQDKYGASLLRKIKSNLGFNAFDACQDKRNRDILALYQDKTNPKSAADIAIEYGLTRDHVYGILHDFGMRSKPTRKEYHKRNQEILKAFQGGKSSTDIAAEYEMTITNINIILKNQGARNRGSYFITKKKNKKK